MIERKSGQSLWRQIADDISYAIRSGTYPPGSKNADGGRVVATIWRQSAYASSGCLRAGGRGYYPRGAGPGQFRSGACARLSCWQENALFGQCIATEAHPGGHTLLLMEEAGDPSILKQLGLSRGARVVRLDQIGEVDGRPISVGSHYFPPPRCLSLPSCMRNSI